MWLSIVAFIGFALWYIVDLPVKNLPELRIPYYINLPHWLNNIFVFTAALGLVAFIISRIRKNTSALLQIEAVSVTITSQPRVIKINFKQLERIAFIEKSLAFSPYRIEFIYKNSHFVRIKISSEEELEQIISALLKVLPSEVEVSYTKFESSEK